jgi:hyaluronate lyase
MPGASEQATAAMATSPDVAVVANTDQVQAVTRAIGGGSVTMANFWSANAPKTAGITVDKPASLVVSRRGRRLAVAVSDPTQMLTETITVTIDGSFGNVSSTDPGVNVLATSPNIVISVPMTGSAGKTFVARFEVASPQDGGKPTETR